MNREVLTVSLRNKAIVIPESWMVHTEQTKMNHTTGLLVAKCAQLGYALSEPLLHKLNGITPKKKLEIIDFLEEVTGVKKNWTPLVKQWDIPTEESSLDHIMTLFANVFKSRKGRYLPCGHLIPHYTFPIERYNGCPFCGTPFQVGKLEYELKGDSYKVLELWTEEDLTNNLLELLASPVALDATQADSLKVLLANCELPSQVDIHMKETLMLVVDTLIEMEKPEQASNLFHTPNDILRYLWYKHTGFLQVVEPKTIIARSAKNGRHLHRHLDTRRQEERLATVKLKLKYSRKECRMYANWLNNLEMDIGTQCEMMHPKRSMWVRVIRALRLAEYSKKKGFERLAKLMDVFYKKEYDVWQGRVNEYIQTSDAERAFKLLKQRPGQFARSLFSTMLWLGPDEAIANFSQVIDQVPARLVFSLNMYAEFYFDKNATRVVKPLGGVSKKIPANPMTKYYGEKDLKGMQQLVSNLSLEVIKRRFSKEEHTHKTIFIDESLFRIPVAIGDRSEHVQDLPEAAMGTRFKVEGDKVRLFMQWGEGLPAQHLDMDLSCVVAYEKSEEVCSYQKLVIHGAKHSGDIQRIPHKVGTAEYIDIDLNKLEEAGAQYVSFTCNAYTRGSLAPNLVVGWMNSKHKMKISSSGVAYNPTHVQHQVRIKKSLTKGMVFGVLDMKSREMIWLEMGFNGQLAQNMDIKVVKGLISKLESKLKIGDLLKLKAEVQGLDVVVDPETADEVYDENWGRNTAQVSNFLFG